MAPAGCEHLGKSLGLLCPGNKTIHQLICQLQKEAIPVQHSYRVLEVSWPGFLRGVASCGPAGRLQGHRSPEGCVHGEPPGYGSRRLVTAMAGDGFQIGRYEVRSLMRKAALS